MIDLKGMHYPKHVILFAVFFYVRYSVSYRDLEDIMQERGVNVDHATLNRWVVKYSPVIVQLAKKKRKPTSSSWRMDETYIKAKGRWCYYYRAIDKFGATLDFMLSTNRDEVAATRFFKQAIDNNGLHEKVVIDKSGANYLDKHRYAGFMNINTLLFFFGFTCFIDILRVEYLNNIIEQDHRFIKKITKPMMNFKAFHSASATLAGIELAHMIRKKQFKNPDLSDYHQFLELVA
jgi:putative transposase